jgi:hypothetical protein
MNSLTMRTRLEIVAASCAALLGIVTVFWHDWIEALTGWDPDSHSGGVEWIVVGLLLMLAIALGLSARRHWKLLASVPDQ